MVSHAKINIRNFGAERIFVISDPKNEQRRKDFIEAWSSFEGFEFEFVDAIMGDNIDVEKLLNQGDIYREFRCPVGSLSNEIIGVALSHKKVWNKILELNNEKHEDPWYLILEDDARPTKELCDYIYDGQYKKLLYELKNLNISFFYWGKCHQRIEGSPLTPYIIKHKPISDRAAHAYMLRYNQIKSLIKSYKVQMAVDTYLDKYFNDSVFSPHKSFIRQQGHILDKFFMHPNDPDFLYSSGTQKNHFIYEVNDRDDWGRIHPNIKNKIKMIHKEGKWKVITLK